MKIVLNSLLSRARNLADTEPLIALFLGAALLAVFLSALKRNQTAESGGEKPSLIWVLYGHLTRLVWATSLVAFLAVTISVLRTYLHQTVANFQRTHGRVTTANYNAVQTIWGAEQTQAELNAIYYVDEEQTERIESEDLTKPAVLRKKNVRHVANGNPFISARHEVTLKQNPRKKGSAFYGGYETDCQFYWKLKNPTNAAQRCKLTFPLPANGAMYDAMTATLNGTDVLTQMEIKEGSLVLAREAAPSETIELAITFKSRGVSFWYFQVKEAREIRDFTLRLALPDLPKSKLNYPEGCMTPTEIKPTSDNAGCVLTYRLDHALSNKGMGIALPELPQPGAVTGAVLAEVERAWLLIFATLMLTMTLTATPHSVLLTVMFSVATGFVYGLLGDFSDVLFGFIGTAALVQIPLLVILSLFLRKLVPSAGKRFWLLPLFFGILYPLLAGLDEVRQTLYLNVCAAALLIFIAWLLARQLRAPTEEAPVGLSPTAGGGTA